MCNIPFTLVIPQHLQEDIVNRLEDAVHIARVKCVCKSLRSAASRVRSLRIICKEEYHASVRDENPSTALPHIKPIRGGADPATLSTSQADGLTEDIQKTKNDSTPVGPLHDDTQDSSGTQNGVYQGCQSDSGITKHPLEKVAEGPDAPHEVVEGSNRVRSLGIICKEEYHASVRDDDPPTALPDIKPIRADQATSQADGLTDGIQKTKNDSTHVGIRDDTQNSCGNPNGVYQGCQSDSGITNNCPLEKVAEDPDAQHEVIKGSDLKKRTWGQRETLCEAEVCNQQPPCNQNSSDQALQDTCHNSDTSKGNLPETLRDDNGNFPNGSSKKPKLEGDVCVEDSQAGKASTPETKEETDAQKGHLQETQRDDNDNFLSRSSKRLKLEGEFTAVNPQDGDASTSGAGKEPIFFRQILPTVLQGSECVAQLRIEVEPKLQSKVVPEAERKCTDHWMTDPLFVNKWIRYVQSSIQHLCIVDYGQQAIMRRSSILTVISQTCSVLKTLDLRNMFLDTKGCKDMPNLASFTLRCVKVNGNVLQEINMRMRNLQTLALLGVFGVQEGHLTLPELKVLCLGLSTKAKSVKIELPNLGKLQLKMSCPEVLHIYAPVLQFVAFNLEILDCSLVGFEHIKNLRELLYGASQFTTLSKLVQKNLRLDKTFLDIPCMALDEDGKWLGVLPEVALNVPSFETLQSECLNMQVLNIGPGLWHSMETVHYSSLTEVQAWPPITRLILHMIPHTLESSVAVLLLFITVMPKLRILEVKVHTDSPVDYDSFIDAIKSHVPHLMFRAGRWTKSLDFSCFSF